MNNSLEKNKVKRRLRFTSYQIIVIGFALTVLVGSLLLVLPVSSKERVVTPFIDALFTATSAVCVTGLVVRNAATYWSGFGQAVIIILIQIGGVGIITVVAWIARFAGYKIGLLQRSTLQEAVSAHKVGSILRLSLFILKTTLFIEFIGAVLLFPVMYARFGVWKGIWYSVFHSISAFCNAGFDLLGVETEYISVCEYVGNPLLNLTIMALIVSGGLGFITWHDIRRHGIHLRRYCLQSKIVIVCTVCLIFIPAIFFYFGEFSRDVWSDLTVGEKILASLFQSVTTRTAGFNSVDLTLLSDTSVFIMVILMIIGASPGSTAGGMKTTTVAVVFATLFSVLRRRSDTQLFGRRVGEGTIKMAVSVLLMYISLFTLAAMVISVGEGEPLLDCLFETASAIGTVGLTRGMTPFLGVGSKLILIFLMFFGRVGGITIMYAVIAQKPPTGARLPEEKISV